MLVELSRVFAGSNSQENRPQTDGICVANHTSPIDVVILSADRPYALVGLQMSRSFGGKILSCFLRNI